ncbi:MULTISPECIES: NAD(P)-dependent oxidoreductase [unclassified Micromonospora]|uniref:NAD(P)-dependent oxidoreductase n=1 Tax=unclassified Micromonospora TaxID=2617518 RepID=UPI001B38DD27|nr:MULTISPECIES: NAD(P)-binding domain-containing protein [unclassified Micromonospora]MBQ1040913.1 NAD(P)-dependent oxidoreductase [Micromonospora sp. C72]MBQ1055281.1 NAD(P)-dependent oxidoreductase [Micromonospora sp. C32]
MATIAIVGFGDMGEQMAPHLLAAGHQVRVSDISDSRLEKARRIGTTAVASAAEAARGADVIFGLVMSNDIPTAYLGDDGILAGAQPGASVLICSTTTRAIVDQVRAAAPSGVAVLDSPIVGGVKYARERTITFLVGGSADDFGRVKSVLDDLGRSRHLGEFGAGVDYKLITNVAIMAAEAGLREALDLADILGRDYETSLELMAAGPMRAVVERALDVANPRPLRRSAEDDDTLVSAVDDPARLLPISTAGRQRLWEAVNVDPNFEPDFVDLTRKTTSRAAGIRS